MGRRARSIRLLAGAALLVAPLVVTPPNAAAAGLVAHTRYGNVKGIATSIGHEWRGIPYAAPPVGDLRWHPPVPPKPWSGSRDATRFRPWCAQLAPDLTGTVGREDCLYLNVFAPADAAPGSNLPVMVHLHPGSNYFLGPYENPAAFVERGVVVVTVAYRLGVMAFFGRDDLRRADGTSGEYASLDQIAALRWVQDDIAAFGGDPDRVTLFGSSAGSFDTVALLASPLARGLFAQASVQGEPYWGFTGKLARIRIADIIGRHTARLTGCDSSPDVVACLRSIPARRLVRIEGPGDVAPFVGGLVLPRSPIKLLSEDPSSTPLLVGFDREEDRYFLLGYPIPSNREFTREDFRSAVADLVGADHAREARRLYPPSSYGSRAWAFVTMGTDMKRGCPTRRLANVMAGPTWRWLDTHVYENDPSFADGRAAHIYEEPFLWNDFDLFGFGYTPTPAEEALSAQMVGYWTNFAKTGDPNGPGLPAWPSYDASTERTLTLDDPIGIVDGYHTEQCAFLDSLGVPFPRTASAARAQDPLVGVTP
jgi:para-nitrobenzyl esterase